MNLPRALVLVAVLVAGWQWHRHRTIEQSAAGNSATGAASSVNGFASLPLPAGMDSESVVVFSPENCPSEEAQRAEALIHALEGERISVVRSHEAEFQITDPQAGEQVAAVMNGPIPIVFVRGKAKANPSAAEVIAEFRRR